MAWKCDVRLDFVVAKTEIQAGKLRLTIGYGAPPSVTNLASNSSVFKNQVMEFTQDNYQHSVLIEYNAATEYLYSKWTDHQYSQASFQNFSFASVAVFVQNALRSVSGVVTNTAEVLVFLSLQNCRMYETMPFSPTYFLAAADEVEVIDPVMGDQQQPPIYLTTNDERQLQPALPCQ